MFLGFLWGFLWFSNVTPEIRCNTSMNILVIGCCVFILFSSTVERPNNLAILVGLEPTE